MVDLDVTRSARRRRRGAVTLSEPAAILVVTPASTDDECAGLRGHIAERLVVLRTEFQNAVASYSVRVQGMLSQAGDLLMEDAEKFGSSDRKHREKALRRIMGELDTMDLKPSKGRRRDLKAIELLAIQLSDEVSTW